MIGPSVRETRPTIMSTALRSVRKFRPVLVAAGTVGRHGVRTPGDYGVARAAQGRRPATEVLKAAECVERSLRR